MGGVNAALTLVLVIHSYADPYPLIVYMSAVLLVGGYGTAVLLAARRRSEQASDGWLRIAVSSASAAFLAVGIMLIGLGFVYGCWLMLVALYPLLLAAILVRREQLSTTVIPRGRRPLFDPATGHAQPRIVAVDLAATAPADTPPLEAAAESHDSAGVRAAGFVAALGLAASAVLGIRHRRRDGRRTEKGTGR